MLMSAVPVVVLLLWLQATGQAADAVPGPSALPLIADNQQFLALNGTTNNGGKNRNTYQNMFRIKVAATGLVFPLTQSYSSWNESEAQKEFSNATTYRAAVSCNRGPWMPLRWKGLPRVECAFQEVVRNDPLMLAVKPGDTLYLRTEITVPAGGRWGLGAQARGSGPEPNWTEGATNSDADVLLSNEADFRPQAGLYTHTAQGVFGTPIGGQPFHSALILGDSISPYVLTAALATGDSVPVAYFGQPAESAARFWNAGAGRHKLLGGCEVLLYQYGVNDLRGHTTFEALRDAARQTWQAFKAAGGKRLVIFTATPLARSTDHFATLAGQTPDFVPEVRAQWNDYLRELRQTDIGLEITVIDTAALFEAKPNDSLWRPLDSGGATTDDGCHPNAAGYARIEKMLGPAIRAAITQ